jgi:hypothetical protein
MHATQPLLAFIDADDEYAPGALSVASGFLQQVPSAASIRLDVEYTGFPAEISEHPLFEECCAALSNTVPSNLIIRRPVYAALGGFPMDDFFRRGGGEDAAFAMALSATGVSPVPSLCACTIIRAPMPGTTSGFPWACRRRIWRSPRNFSL